MARARVYYPQCRAILSVMFDGFGPSDRDSDPFIIPVLPKSATVVRNSYNQADSWEITFDAEDMPIDPRMVRAGQAEVYLFSAPALRAEDQRLINRQSLDIEGDPEEGPSAAGPTQVGRLTGALESVRRDRNARARRDRFTQDNDPTIVGLFDDQSIALSGNGRWATIAGQDYTAYLANRQWPPLPNGRARKIPVGKRIDELLSDILAKADPRRRLSLSVENLDDELLPNVGPGETRSNRRGIPIEQGTTYWDVMTKLASRYGFILYVRGLDVVLTRPQNLNEDSAYRVRRMAFGKNITDLELTRHLGKETAPTIVVKSYDEKTKRTITAEYPPRSFEKVKAKQRTGDGDEDEARSIRKDDEYQVIPLYGVTDQEVMARAAESLHTILGKAERVVRFATKDLDDMQGKSLMDLAAGDALTIDFEEFNLSRSLLSDADVPFERKVQHLLARGYNAQVANVIARKFDELRLLDRPLRLREATYEFSDTEGIRIEAELIDFIVVDGIRDASAKTPRADKRTQRDRDGKLIGFSKAQEQAAIRQHGRNA